MSDISFRGKRKDTGEWAYGISILNSGKGPNLLVKYEEKRNFDLFPVNSDTIGEYVDIVDKNGEKIFTGDIVIIGNGFIKKRGTVIVENGLYYFRPEEIGHIYFGRPRANLGAETSKYLISTFKSEEIKVIGNIYDNPCDKSEMIKRCPFCGSEFDPPNGYIEFGESKHYKPTTGLDTITYFIHCKKCDITMERDTAESVIKDWNNREHTEK